MAYEFDEPFVLDTTKYESTFGAAGTPLADALAATVAWYRDPLGLPRLPVASPHLVARPDTELTAACRHR